MRIIVPYGRDGASDRVARVVVPALAARRGVAIEFDYRPGGGTIPGTLAAVQASADGHTLLFATVTNWSIAPLLDTSIPYEPARDLALLGLIGYAPNVLAVPASLGVRSVAELIDRARAAPGGLAYASAGAGQTIHLCGAAFAKIAGIDLRHVPYAEGSAAAYRDLTAGRVHLMFDSYIGARDAIASGALRALAVVGSSRLAALPAVPTLAQAGFPSLQAPIWFGIAVAAAVPAPVRSELAHELGAVLEQDAVQSALAMLGLEMRAAEPDPLNALDQCAAVWRDNILLAGLLPAR